MTTLHLNRDTELTEVTVSSAPAPVDEKWRSVGEGDGEWSTRGPTTTVLKTTANHPSGTAVPRRELTRRSSPPRTSTLVGPHGETQYVTKVHSYTGAKNMRDLTVATIHTYYVLAGDTPVLVHNGPGWTH